MPDRISKMFIIIITTLSLSLELLLTPAKRPTAMNGMRIRDDFTGERVMIPRML